MNSNYRPMPDSVRASLIAFARETWLNDGAEGETVHRLCDELEWAHLKLREPKLREPTELGALLALVPGRWELQVVRNSTTGEVWQARWSADPGDPVHDARHPSDREAAIRTATEQLLGLEPADGPKPPPARRRRP